MYYLLCIVHNVLHTAYCALRTVLCVLRTIHYVLGHAMMMHHLLLSILSHLFSATYEFILDQLG